MEGFLPYIIIPLLIGFGFGFLIGKAKSNSEQKDKKDYWTRNKIRNGN
jgi:hypothetical protein